MGREPELQPSLLEHTEQTGDRPLLRDVGRELAHLRRLGQGLPRGFSLVHPPAFLSSVTQQLTGSSRSRRSHEVVVVPGAT